MATIVSSFVDPQTGNAGATAPGGASVTITPARVQGLVNQLSGTVQAHQTVQAQLAQIIADTLGPQNCTPDQVEIDYDDNTFFVTDLTFLS